MKQRKIKVASLNHFRMFDINRQKKLKQGIYAVKKKNNLDIEDKDTEDA